MAINFEMYSKYSSYKSKCFVQYISFTMWKARIHLSQEG